MSKIVDFKGLGSVREDNCLVIDDAETKIVHCHGVFDVLHAGHLEHFKAAKSHGDVLVVTVTADRHVNKGPGRPHFPAEIRARMVAALEIVDYVAISDFPSAVQAIEELKPNVYAKGPDYRDKTKDYTREIYNEEEAVAKVGGQIVYTDGDTFSASTLANKFFINWSEDQQQCIAEIKGLGGFSLIEEVVRGFENQRVVVLGEPIIDVYRFCQPQNISSKSPSISAEFLYEEQYAGGSLAIANHLADFVGEVSLVIPYGNEERVRRFLKDKLDPRIKLFTFETNAPTPRKTRYIAMNNSQRMFEITQVKNHLWQSQKPTGLLNFIKKQDPDLFILADFGHGLFEGEVLLSMSELKGFVSLNVQTNSSNYGFNPFLKHKRYNYLSLDVNEARVAYHDRLSPPLELFSNTCSRNPDVNHSLTLGKNGAYFYGQGCKAFSPAFSDTVVDTVGAGDAYFAITSLFARSGSNPRVVPFIGNVFAGLKTKIIGNKSAVGKAQLLKSVQSILR